MEKGSTSDDVASSAPSAATSVEPRAKAAKTADRPHSITIALGLVSPILALVSLGVSFYVFHDSKQSMQVAQRAYLGFHFEDANAQPVPVPAPAPSPNERPRYLVTAKVSVKDIGNTPAYIKEVRQELYVIDGDDMEHHIGGSHKISPNFDALVPKGDALSLEYESKFVDQDLVGDKSVVYRIEILWVDAFGVRQSTPYCTILRSEEKWTSIRGSFPLLSEPCIKNWTVEFLSGER